MKIMVVDDADDIRRLLVKRLTSAGYEVVAFPNPLQALAAVKAENPDLALLDINMPDMDGFELCRRIVADNPDLPVVFLSARGDVDDKLVGFEAGGRDYLAKPFSPAELLARVKATLREKSSMDEAKKHAEEQKTLAITDALTGVSNRRYFDERFREELERTIRYNDELSCAMIDIDNFKSFNDTYGHSVGDTVLVNVAHAIKETVRTMDIVARYGGEEFVVLFPQTTLEQASASGERIRAAIEGVKLGGGLPTITASIGVAAGVTEQMVKEADKALYIAKRNGKNRVEVHRDEHAESAPATT